MRLDFKVLWIDDQLALVRGAMEKLQFHIEEEGFRLKVTPAESLERATELISNGVWADGIDLVLVDYDLGTGSGGERALARVKNALPYKEVVFYSSRETADLRRLAYESGVEGVYCANRVNLGETITEVFDALVKKVLDIDHCRGIILGATSDLDYLVNDMLRAIDAKLSASQRSSALEFGLERIDLLLKKCQTKREELIAGGTMEALLADNQVFTAVDRLRLLIKLHDHHFGASQPQLRKAIGRYTAKIPNIRNIFGHVRLKPGDPQAALRGFGGETVDPETLKSVRKELIEFRDQFYELAGLVGCVDVNDDA